MSNLAMRENDDATWGEHVTDVEYDTATAGDQYCLSRWCWRSLRPEVLTDLLPRKLPRRHLSCLVAEAQACSSGTFTIRPSKPSVILI